MGPQTEIRTTKVSAGEYEFNLHQSGDPSHRAVLFLHGSGPGATALSNWEAALTDLGDEYFCLAPDVVGFGDSTHPDPPPQGIAPFTELRIDTLLGLLDELGIEKVSLVGNSMGGMWSLGMTRKAPDRVDKIVLMGSGGAPIPPGPALPKLITFYDEPTAGAMAALMRSFVYDEELLGDDLQAIAETRQARAVRPEVERSHRATFDLTEMWELTEADLANVTQDVLIVHGREDRMVVFDAAVYFFERLPNARLYGIGKCGHWTQIEHRDRFAAAVRGFLAGQL